MIRGARRHGALVVSKPEPTPPLRSQPASGPDYSMCKAEGSTTRVDPFISFVVLSARDHPAVVDPVTPHPQQGGCHTQKQRNPSQRIEDSSPHYGHFTA